MHRWGLGMEKLYHPTLYNGCNYLSMLGLKLIYVSEKAPDGSSLLSDAIVESPMCDQIVRMHNFCFKCLPHLGPWRRIWCQKSAWNYKFKTISLCHFQTSGDSLLNCICINCTISWNNMVWNQIVAKSHATCSWFHRPIEVKYIMACFTGLYTYPDVHIQVCIIDVNVSSGYHCTPQHQIPLLGTIVTGNWWCHQ